MPQRKPTQRPGCQLAPLGAGHRGAVAGVSDRHARFHRPHDLSGDPACPAVFTWSGGGDLADEAARRPEKKNPGNLGRLPGSELERENGFEIRTGAGPTKRQTTPFCSSPRRP